MERRGVLSLGSRDYRVSLKEERSDSLAADARSQMQWTFSDKVSGPSQFLSFKASEEDKLKKVVPDLHASPGSPTADVFKSKWKLQSAESQSMTLDRNMQEKDLLAIYPKQQLNGNSVHHPQEVKIFSGSTQLNLATSLPLTTSVLQSNLSSVKADLVCSTMNSQPLGGVPVLPPVSLPPSTRSTVGYTDYSAPKPLEAPAQMTIFYAGSVNVYNDVSPEKAQAIMLLAGNGPAVALNKTLSSSQGHGGISMTTSADGVYGNQSHNISAFLGLPNLVSVTSQAGSPVAGTSTCTSNPAVAMGNNVGAFACPISLPETSKPVTSIGSSASTLFPTVALPQARKASLARFLEKRKERVISSSPYATGNKSSECSAVPSDNLGCSVVDSSAACLHPTAK